MSSPLRALVVFHVGGVNGPQHSLDSALAWIERRGTVEFMLPESGPAAEFLSGRGEISFLKYAALGYPRGLRQSISLLLGLGRDVHRFRRALRRRRPDLVVAVTTVLPALLVAARLERVPTVVYAAEIYGRDSRSAPLLRAWGRVLIGLTATLSSGVVSCSHAVAGQFPRQPRRPRAVAYPSIGPSYAGGDRRRGRDRLGLPQDCLCVSVIGSISRGRGQDVALCALPALRRRFPSLCLLVVGDAHSREVDRTYRRELRAIARDLGVDDAVVFAGAVHGTSAMADVYAAADLVVNPARIAEAFGRVAAEALVAGRPVVASRVGGIPEVIRDGRDGLLVAPDDPDALAIAVGAALADPVLAETLVQSGRTHVLEQFGEGQDEAAWAHVLGRALSRSRH